MSMPDTAIAEDRETRPTPHRRCTAALLRTAGVDAGVVEFEQPTRTSAEAADAIGCTEAEIAKSIVFRGKASGQAVVVASGDNRVSEAKVAALVGESLGRADADFVRAQRPATRSAAWRPSATRHP